ncbi:MAG TPA: mycofactocin-coupled SDR family oxidoreductase [Trebonia sp.]|nr:mycofactocin-coupled SDR family oxidoreductase [Trebonia sp.]
MGDTLDGQVAVITGGARGQGRADAVALARLGARIAVCDAPAPMTSVRYELGTAEDLARTVSLVREAGSEAIAVAADVRDPAAVAAVADAAIAEFGQVDILVANAGIVSTGRLWELTDEAWQEMIGTNLTGVFNAMRAVVPHMRERRYGRIVAISSQGGRAGLPGISHYSAAKWGIIGLAKSLALEVAAEGITVNVVAPGTVRTPMVVNDATVERDANGDPLSDEILGKRFAAHHPIPRPWIYPEDVAREVVHLVTEPGNITGAVIEIGLGQSARMH